MGKDCVCIGCTFVRLTSNMENLASVFKAKEYYERMVRGKVTSNRIDKGLSLINSKLSNIKV